MKVRILNTSSISEMEEAEAKIRAVAKQRKIKSKIYFTQSGKEVDVLYNVEHRKNDRRLLRVPF